jgi:hypothetical protein
MAGLVSDVHCIIEAMIGRSGDVELREPDLEGVAATVMCDPDRLRGVLLNLYTNAAKFTKQVRRAGGGGLLLAGCCWGLHGWQAGRLIGRQAGRLTGSRPLLAARPLPGHSWRAQDPRR